MPRRMWEFPPKSKALLKCFRSPREVALGDKGTISKNFLKDLHELDDEIFFSLLDWSEGLLQASRRHSSVAKPSGEMASSANAATSRALHAASTCVAFNCRTAVSAVSAGALRGLIESATDASFAGIGESCWLLAGGDRSITVLSYGRVVRLS